MLTVNTLKFTFHWGRAHKPELGSDQLMASTWGKLQKKVRMTNWSHFFQVGKHVKYFCGTSYMPHLHRQAVRCPGSVDHVTILRSGLSALTRSQKWNKPPCSILWTHKLLQEQLAAEPEAAFIMRLLVPVWPAAVTHLTPANGSRLRAGGSRGPLH